MPRLLSSLAVLGLVTPVVVALPVATPSAAAPHPVAPSVRHLTLAAAPAPAGAAVGPALLRRTAALTASGRFSTVGVTWRPGRRAEPPVVRARWRSGSTWSAWTVLPDASDDVPDPTGVDRVGAVRPGTAPVWIGWAREVQVTADTAGGLAPQDLRLELVDPGTSAADVVRTPPATARAAEPQPVVLTRSQWGADESLRRGTPSYSRTVKAGFVHHTVNANTYSAADVPALLRGIYAYHVKSNGWSDIGYNFLIDRFGRTWEGRAGGITAPVIGAHTGGFNTDTFGTSLLGTYSSVPPPQVTLTALAALLAWKLGAYYRDPLATATLRSAGGGTARYAAGTTHPFEVVSGHRDAGNTSCPGDAAYALIPQVRAAVDDRIGPGFVDPQVSTSTAYVGRSTPIVLTAGITHPATWTVQVSDAAGAPVRTFTGVDATTVRASWDFTDALGLPVPPGVYTMRLVDVDAAGRSGLPYTAEIRYRVPAFAKGSWLRPDGFFPKVG